ncbi:MAG: DNA polymerase III subunit beta [Candidatus Competibacterales bacterium]
MKLEAPREHLLQPLQSIIGVVERRQTMPILANVLIGAQGENLVMGATDLEAELWIQLPLASTVGTTTLPARKLQDILRALPEGAQVSLQVDDGEALLRCGRSRFKLFTLPADEFPTLEDVAFDLTLELPARALRTLLEHTHFAMAQQDVRYYLNGLLLEFDTQHLRAVATDGHRLAHCQVDVDLPGLERQVIVPRKGIQELLRLLADDDTPVTLSLGTNHIQAQWQGLRLTSKLIDGKFPDYQRVIPRQQNHLIVADRQALRTALTRTAILSNDKHRGVRLTAHQWAMQIQAQNPEREEAEEEVEVNYDGEALELGFNVTYLLDALNALDGELVELSFADAHSSCLIRQPESDLCQYVVMPMRL